MNPELRRDRIAKTVPAYRVHVDREQWQQVARTLRDAGGDLLALWGSDDRDRGAGFVVRAAWLANRNLEVLELAVPADEPVFPSLTPLAPEAGRMERAVRDLLGVSAEGTDDRPWLRQAAWTSEQFPLRRDFDGNGAGGPSPDENYSFVRVEGEGVHEIAVGPVHAGIIEPGHFRFSVVGEKVLRLEERLGYVHKGIEKRFESMSLLDGHRLAARVSGDSAVAFSWAYCMALEDLAGATVPARALYLRALALELERLANHLGDLGALGNDAGLGFGLAQFSRIKEELLRLNARLFGARYLLDFVVPGGVASDLDDDARQTLLGSLDPLEKRVRNLHEIYDEHAGLQDRFAGAGWLASDLANVLGVVGLVGRASGQLRDARCDFPVTPYDKLAVQMASHTGGDVAARVAVRFDEVIESIRLCRAILRDMPGGEVRVALPPVEQAAFSVGLVEGWRGPAMIALEAGEDGRVRRCHPHDPSWQNWPALEHAILGNIVPDFPLINKSFNLSYSGHDL
jgi:Ni,Fe-hydrogenase III large subunit/Ni,Fe-hydrogenase III component G